MRFLEYIADKPSLRLKRDAVCKLLARLWSRGLYNSITGRAAFRALVEAAALDYLRTSPDPSVRPSVAAKEAAARDLTTWFFGAAIGRRWDDLGPEAAALIQKERTPT